MTIKIDSEFKSLIPPLTKDERRQLEENVLADGCLDSLKVWEGMLLDGHNRYDICTEHGLTFRTEEIPLDSREDAIIWICKNQTGRRNITDEQKTYLLGKQYEATKKLHGGDRKSKDQCEPLIQSGYVSTADKVATEMGIGSASVKRAEKFAQGVDAIGQVEPEFKSEILTGKTSATKKDIRAIATLPEPERPAAIERIRRGEKLERPIPEPREISPVNVSDIEHALDRTFREFADTISNLLDVHRDLIDTEPQRFTAIFDKYIDEFKEMKEGIS